MKLFATLFLGLAVLPAALAAPAPQNAKTAAQSPQAALNTLLAKEPLRSAIVSVRAITPDGKVLLQSGSVRKMVPASNTKLITTGVALKALGADYRFTTRIACDGAIRDSVLAGDLYILGGGDPTTGSPDSLTPTAEKLFASWKKMLDRAGIRKIEGRVIGDGRWFEGPIEHPSWEYDDLGTYYGTGMNGLTFYKNTLDLRVEPGDSVGAPVSMKLMYPEVPWMTLRQAATTGKPQTANTLYLYTTDLAPAGEMRGSFPLGRAPKTENASNKYGAYTCAWYFRNYLESNGLPVSGGCADTDIPGNLRDLMAHPTALRDSSGAPLPAACPDSLTVLGATHSAPLSHLLKTINFESDNYFAEAILRAVGKKHGGSAEYEAAIGAERSWLARMGLPTGGALHLEDGSGLSRHNLVSPEWMTAFLRKMYADPERETYMATLPHPGQGTLKNRFKKKDEAFKLRFRMKSGSMYGVLCFSGYLLPSDPERPGAQPVIFSVMVNHCTARSSALGSAVESVLEALSGLN